MTRLRERTRAFGIEASDIRQRHGNLVETLSEQEQDVRLFVLGRRGESADRMQRDLGHNVEIVVRSLHKPILTITRERDRNVSPRQQHRYADHGSV